MADDNTNDGPPLTGDSTSVLPGDITEAIALGGFCAISGQPSSLSNLAYSNAIGNNNLTQQNTLANQQAMNQIGQAVLGNVLNLVTDVSPMEAVAVIKLDTGNDMAQQLMDLQSAVNTGGGTQPSPPRPHRPPAPPQVRQNPSGKGLILAPVQFPVSLNVDDSVPTYKTTVANGVAGVSANSSQFPIYITIGGPSTGPVPPPMTISNISSGNFPVQVKLGTGSGPATVTESPQGTTLTVNRDMFPVEVRVTP